MSCNKDDSTCRKQQRENVLSPLPVAPIVHGPEAMYGNLAPKHGCLHTAQHFATELPFAKVPKLCSSRKDLGKDMLQKNCHILRSSAERRLRQYLDGSMKALRAIVEIDARLLRLVLSGQVLGKDNPLSPTCDALLGEVRSLLLLQNGDEPCRKPDGVWVNFDKPVRLTATHGPRSLLHLPGQMTRRVASYLQIVTILDDSLPECQERPGSSRQHHTVANCSECAYSGQGCKCPG